VHEARSHQQGGFTSRPIIVDTITTFHYVYFAAAPSLLFASSVPATQIAGRTSYLPREVFFGRFAFAGAFFSVWASDFGRFFPATSGSFRSIRVSRPE
jgi:hypothetical protein